MTHSKGNNTPKTISVEPALYKRAKDRAERLGLNFSQYVQNLIKADLGSSGVMVLIEREDFSSTLEEQVRKQHERDRVKKVRQL